MRDFYEILGVPKNASKEDIKKSYRKIAMKYHPDRNPGDGEAEKKFKEAAEAYSILNNEEKRSRYDQFGHAGVGLGDTGAGAAGFGGIHMSMDDIFQQFGDIFGGHNPFEDIFGGTRTRRQVRKGHDLRISLKLDLVDIVNGTEKTVKIKRAEICETCNGSGAKPGTHSSRCRHCGGSGQVRQISRSFFGQSVMVTDCPICQGSGEVIESVCTDCNGNGVRRKAVNIKIKVPKGVTTGNYMTLEGQGNKGGKGIQPGDLIVVFEEKDHPYFVRNDDDVLLEGHISFAQAAMGTTLEVPTLEGKASLKIPTGIQSGQILRMRGKGFPNLRSSHRGDQLVRIQVDTPKALSKREKELFKEMLKLNGVPKKQFTKIRL